MKVQTENKTWHIRNASNKRDSLPLWLMWYKVYIKTACFWSSQWYGILFSWWISDENSSLVFNYINLKKSAVKMNILLHTSQWYGRFFKKTKQDLTYQEFFTKACIPLWLMWYNVYFIRAWLLGSSKGKQALNFQKLSLWNHKNRKQELNFH